MPRTPVAPLYDQRFEHDACGVGFVADAGGRSRARVLPLALAGLAALGHRGAFAADGESSDGAGVSLPLEPELLHLLAPAVAAERPGILQLFLPRGRARGEAARQVVIEAIAAAGLRLVGWRRVPTDTAALGAVAAASRPAFAQAIVARQTGLAEPAFERRLIVLRRRIETAARDAGLVELSVPSASCRTIVYKGLVAGDRLASLYPDLAAGIPLRYAVFHQRYATNTQPAWRLAQPFRWIAHNGEINTVRGNREQVRGRIADRWDAAVGAGGPDRRRGPRAQLVEALMAAGPLLSPGASDSLSLDELLEVLVATGWDLPAALLAAIPEALPLRTEAHPPVAALRRRTGGFLSPWDGPAAIVFADGRRVGALLDRNGLRPLAFAVTADRVVAVASEAGAVPLAPAETVRRGRLGPGELLLIDPRGRLVLEDVPAKTSVLGSLGDSPRPRPVHVDVPPSNAPTATPPALRYLCGLDAERARLDIRTMALEGHEPLWSMGDDTPTPGRGRVDRPVVDHLRQAFAQVTNPPIDPDRERAVLDLGVDVGRRPALLGGMPRGARTVRLNRPVATDGEALHAVLTAGGRRVVRLDTTWTPSEGPAGLEAALERLAAAAVRAARGSAEVVWLSDRAAGFERLPIPSVLAAGALHAALTDAGLRGRADVVVEAGDLLDVHAVAMAIAAGATVVVPWLAVELAAEAAGGRGAEDLEAVDTIGNLGRALEAGLRKTLARMGIGTAASYVGGALFETVELDPGVVARCFPTAPSWPGRVTFADLAGRQLRRLEAARALAGAATAVGRETRLPDPGLARFRADGEAHLYAPRVVAAIQALAGASLATPVLAAPALAAPASAAIPATPADLDAFRASLAREPGTVRDDLRVRRARPVPLREVESAGGIAARFVVSAMSVGALSPEAHQALTIGIQRAGGAANTGEGGEDPAWYEPGPAGGRRDARIKQVASARFGVTAHYLARADQLEIKIAQGSKPGEGGQLPGRKATAYIAALRRAQPGQSLISPPPHHDIYSIEDLAQLVADLRAINPGARIGVKLVATRGVGTIAAGVVKAGATYVHLSGHAGGTGASPLSSIKHAGVPWELGLAEVHQILLRNGLRDRVALRTDGGLQTGRDLLVAALLGAEEFAFGTAALVAIGCDMARQCHLDTCPTGIATQREDLRAKFAGTPEQAERFFLSLAEDLRHELAAIGARSVGEVVGDADRLAPGRSSTHDLRSLVGVSTWTARPARRAAPATAGRDVPRVAASALEERLVRALRGQPSLAASGLRLATVDRSFGAALSGAIERGEIRGPVRLELSGAAGQSFGAFATAGLELRLTGQANDYVGKGLSGGRVVVAPEPDLATTARSAAIAGNACLYGATGGRLHLVGRAGIRFAVRNSGADAVVEGIGAHGCEYMTGGVVAVLGPVGPNFGAGMTGGRAYLYDPTGRHLAAVHSPSVAAARLSAVAERHDGVERLREWRGLLEAQRDAGSALAGVILAADDPADVWLVEPLPADAAVGSRPAAAPHASAHRSSPDRNQVASPQAPIRVVASP